MTKTQEVCEMCSETHKKHLGRLEVKKKANFKNLYSVEPYGSYNRDSMIFMLVFQTCDADPEHKQDTDKHHV
jgi:hypothetical protein